MTAIPLIVASAFWAAVADRAAVAERRHGPTLTGGGIAGLLSAGPLAATLYASHCTDDSPFFVATWYTISTALGHRHWCGWAGLEGAQVC